MRPQQSARAELIAPEKAGQGQPEAGLIRRGFLEEADVVEGTQAPGREGPREQPCGSWAGPGGESGSEGPAGERRAPGTWSGSAPSADCCYYCSLLVLLFLPQAVPRVAVSPACPSPPSRRLSEDSREGRGRAQPSPCSCSEILPTSFVCPLPSAPCRAEGP